MGTSVISTMNTLFWICLSFTVLFFVISVVLFFVFDIRTIFNIRTGRARAKTVKEMKAANENTGRLRVAGKTQTSKLSEREKSVSREPAVIPPKSEEKSQYYNDNGDEGTEVLGNERTQVLGDAGTEVLNQPAVQSTNYAETSVLSENNYYHTEDIQNTDDEKPIAFRVVKKELYVHTNEMI